jgi:hypothetical protein
VRFPQYSSEDALGQDIVAFAERGTGEKVTSLGDFCRMMLV